jgi:hypothetical protein
MNINELTLGQIREIQAMIGCSTKESSDYGFFKIGQQYFIRTVTHHHTGRLVGFDRGGKELILEKCAWIADDGRLTDSLEKGEFNEVEMFPNSNVLVNRETIIDAVPFDNELPAAQK